jgi:hypothetical protein
MSGSAPEAVTASAVFSRLGRSRGEDDRGKVARKTDRCGMANALACASDDRY